MMNLSIGGAALVSAILIAIVIFGDFEPTTNIWLLGFAGLFSFPLLVYLIAMIVRMCQGSSSRA